MTLIITDDDVRRLLPMTECIEAMRTAFKDLADGTAVSPPRLRYNVDTPDLARRYHANIHAGAVPSAGTACVRAGSHTFKKRADPSDGRRVRDNPRNWSVVILYDLETAEPLAFLHETYLSGLRVGATTGLAVAETARDDAAVLGLFGTGHQAAHAYEAICAVRPIERVRVFSPNGEHRHNFVRRMARDGIELVAVDRPEDVVAGADIVCCATSAMTPVFDGTWLTEGQMVITIVNSDVTVTRTEADETTFARSRQIILNDWESVRANRQVELLEPLEKGLVEEEQIFLLGDIASGRKSVRQSADGILYYKSNTGLAIQFAAAGAVIYRKMMAEGGGRSFPTEWLAAEKYMMT